MSIVSSLKSTLLIKLNSDDFAVLLKEKYPLSCQGFNQEKTLYQKHREVIEYIIRRNLLYEFYIWIYKL